MVNNSKVVILGDSTVGKSSILYYFKNNKFFENMDSTIGCEFFAKEIVVDKNNIKLLLWDTAGQEVFRSFTPNFLRGAKIVIIVYDITNYDSYINIDTWLQIINIKPVPKIVICGTKIDLVKIRDYNINYIDELKLKYTDLDITYFGRVSGKTGVNIDKLFETVGRKILEISYDNNQCKDKDKSTVTLTNKNISDKKCSC